MSEFCFSRPLLLVGHGSRDPQGQQDFLNFAAHYQALEPSRPVAACFLELATPPIGEAVEALVYQGYRQLSVVPLLLFAAQHHKLDITRELDRARQRHLNLQMHYGRPLGVTREMVDLWQQRLENLNQSPDAPPRRETVLLFVGRGSSDPDANGDTVKLARLLWEGSGYQGVETCFIGITHPRLEAGLERARSHHPKRIIVVPHLLFTGLLGQKIKQLTVQHQLAYPQIQTLCLPEMGLHPNLFDLLRQREQETYAGPVAMNCDLCKFRLPGNLAHPKPHHHHHDHSHEVVQDPYQEPAVYHDLVWQP